MEGGALNNTPWMNYHVWPKCGWISIRLLKIDQGSVFFIIGHFSPLIPNPLWSPLFILLHWITTMPHSTTPSQTASQSRLQVPGQTSRLRPASPVRKQPGFVITPSDSRTALTRHLTPDDESSNNISHRPASPWPPVRKNTTPLSKGKGKVSPSIFEIVLENCLLNDLLITSRLGQQLASVPGRNQEVHLAAHKIQRNRTWM